MDHKLAESNSLVHKYLLDELAEHERMEFEEHLFACDICSEQVRQDFTLIETLKSLTPEEVPERAVSYSRAAGWREWFRIQSLVPAFAALILACVLGFEHFAGAPGEMVRVLPVAVINPLTRGAGNVPSIHPDQNSPIFQFDVNTETLPAGQFTGEVHSAAGKKILSLPGVFRISSADLQVTLPTRQFPAGRYELVLRPAAEPDSIVTYPFAVEDSK